MNIRIFAATALLAVSTGALAEGQFERTLSVSAAPDLYVSNGGGEIRVHPGSDGSIHIVGHVRPGGWSVFGPGDVNERIRRIVASPPIVQEGNTVRVGQTNDHELFNDIAIDYEITAPSSVALNLHSGSGEIELDRLGRYLSASSGSGSIRVQGVHGAAELSSGSGSIELGESQGDVRAKSGSGGIRIHDFHGALMAHTGSGSIEADGQLRGAGNLSSGSGAVRLRLGPDVHFNLEASTGSGEIRVRFPGAPEMGRSWRHHMTVPINGGGPPLEVRTGSGDIEIEPR